VNKVNKREISTEATGLEVAVIGIAGRFPGARSLEEFWNNLKEGVESIAFFSDTRLEEAGVDPGSVSDPHYIKAAPFIEATDCFDAPFFGYTAGEAEVLDPQAIILLECAWEALEDAGYNPQLYKEMIGVYAGASGNFLWEGFWQLSASTSVSERFARRQLYDKDYLTTAISYRLNLKGPSTTVYTACSTSLVAIHTASRAVLSGECKMALAGGATVSARMRQGYLYQEGMITSPDAHCRAFDARAEGTIFGDGAGMVLLKRLKYAVTDGDHIYAVIKGSAINNDGSRKVGYTAPSIEGQSEVIRMAQRIARVEPESITYVETHGTGTPLGDPVEIEGLKLAFNTQKKHFCGIGSVKTNFGHLDIAAGIAGFIKTVLAINHRMIPPSLHFETPNPKIDFENSAFYVNTKLKQWENHKYPLRAGVSSFGIGGTNAHVVLEEWPGAQSAERKAHNEERTAHSIQSQGRGGVSPPEKSREYQLILLSAKTPSALDKMTQNLVEYFKNNLLNHGNHENPVNPGQNTVLTLADTAYTLQVGRVIHQYRRMLVCKDVPEAVQLLSAPDSGKVKTVYSREDNRPIVFMFSGLGSQYVNMGRDLYENEPVLRREMDRCFEILNGLLDYNIKDILYPCKGEVSSPTGKSPATCNLHLSPGINQPEIAHIVIFIFEYALVQLLMSWGIRPYAMIGYSFGEYTAAWAAGVFSLEDALNLVVSRGRLIQQAPGGAMLSVPLSREAIAPYLNREISLAIDNGPSCIVSGTAAAVAAFEKQMKDNRLVCMRVPVGRALHSPAMTPVLPEFTAILDTIQFNQPQIPYISNVSGDWAAEQEVVLPRYWTTHLISTVRFADGMKVLLKEPNSIFIEIGPGRDISALTQRHIEDSGNQDFLVLNLLKQSHQETADVYLVLNRLGMLWLHGQSINWHGFYGEEKRQRIPLPTYPFAGQRCWIDQDAINIKEIVGKRSGGIGTRQPPDFVHWFYMPSWSGQTLLRPVHQEVPQQLKPNCLVFPDDCGIGLRLVKRLKQEGYHVITVEAGTEFLEKSAEVYVICPQQPRHYSRLLDELRSREVLPRRIVHLWGVTPEGAGNTVGPGGQRADWSESVQDKGFYSLVHLAKAIGQLTVTPTMNEPLQIAVVTNQMQEVTGEELLCPAKATVIGPLKVIPQELPGVRCRSIDVVLPGPGGQQEKKIVQQLLEEISTTSVDTEIAYRGNFRWVRTYKPIRLEDSGKKTTKLRQEGVYLVTGGLGKIGFLLARYLAKEVKAKLVLTGRSAFPSRETWDQWLAEHGNENPIGEKIKQMKELEESGAQFRVFSADTADKEKMQTVIAHTIQEWGTINGVIHGAGIMNPGSFRGFQELTRSSCQEHFRSKVEGSLNLQELLQDQPLDFVLFLSSISTVLGGVHFTAYAAANCFMDALARKYNRLNSSRWISVDWDGMDEEKTRKAFWWILSLDNLDQVVASNGGNLQQRIDQWVRLESLGENDQAVKEKSKKRQSRPNLLSAYVPPGTGTEQVLVEAWQRLFGLEPLGIEDDFIELGGDSLKAIMMINQVHKELNVTVPLVEFFKNPTIKWLARYASRARIDVFQSITPVEKKEYYPLSSAQQRLYILHKMNPAALGYNLAATMLLAGKCDMARLEYSFRRLIQRHESLRASFHLIDGETVQQVHDEVGFEIGYYQDKVEEIIRDFIRPFDLSRAPLMRVALIKIAADEHIFVVDMHHIVHDGISQTILFKELTAFYRREELPGLKLQYKDYAGWQNQNMKKEAVKKHELYWLRQFPGEIPVLNLPYDFPRPLVQSFDGSTAAFEIDKKETKVLKTLVRSENVTLFMVLLSIYYVFLSKLSGQEDIVIGTPEAGRKHPDLQPIIGFFLNTLALRNYPCADKSFSDFLKEVKERTLETFENQGYPFEDLVERVMVNRDLTRSPLFDVMFILHTQWASRSGEVGEVPEVPERDAKDLTFKSYYYEKSTSEFDLTLIGFDKGDRLFFKFEYCTRLFDGETIRRFIDYFETILSAVLGNPQQRIEEIGIISESEKQRLLVDFNDTAADYPTDKTIHQLFEEQAERSPNHIALIGVGTRFIASGSRKQTMQVTYRELNEKADRLAQLLREKGVQTGTIAAIMVNRTIQMMVGSLGILKAGGTYLPLDPEYPEARIKYIIEKSGTPVLVTQKNLIDKCKDVVFTGEMIDIFDECFSGEIVVEKIDKRARQSSATAPAYVIYTSGSTGNPKGVVVQHKNAVNFIKGITSVIDFLPGKSILALTTISFDIFFLETLLPVTSGMKVVIADEAQQKDPQLLKKIILYQQVNMLQLTPSRLQLLLSFKDDLQYLSSAEELIVGGEAFPAHLFEQIREKFTGKIYNVYGPTETTIWSTSKDLRRCKAGELTIGSPIANTRVYIVDRHSRLQPLGVAGELLIGGDGVATGYLNNPDLTAEKFDHDLWDYLDYHDESKSNLSIKNYKLQITNKKDPFSQPMQSCNHASMQYHSQPPITPLPHYPIYRTGDLARWLPEGEIEFLGRVDHQVKIRGFRVELEEIEEQLLNHRDIKEAVVVTKVNRNNDKYLAAYIVPMNTGKEKDLDIESLTRYLAQLLPHYMIPSHFIPLDKIPLTPNGKIQRSALPEPGESRLKTGMTYVEPATEEEKIIADIWKVVLGLETIGVNDNFFNLGGNSLDVVRVNQRLQEAFSRNIPVVEQFRYLTVAALTRYLVREEDGVPKKDRSKVLNRGEQDKRKRFQMRKRRV
jgi:iturin family lipopeptide synthetase A